LLLSGRAIPFEDHSVAALDFGRQLDRHAAAAWRTSPSSTPRLAELRPVPAFCDRIHRASRVKNRAAESAEKASE